MGKKADISKLIGLERNGFIVIGDAGVNERKQSQVLLKCKKCGKEKVVKVSHFNISHFSKCDCYIYENEFNGYKFVRNVTEENLLIEKHPTVELQCINCGNTIYTSRYKLNNPMSIKPCDCANNGKIKYIPTKKHTTIKLQSESERIVNRNFMPPSVNFFNYEYTDIEVVAKGINDSLSNERYWCRCNRCLSYDLFTTKEIQSGIRCECKIKLKSTEISLNGFLFKEWITDKTDMTYLPNILKNSKYSKLIYKDRIYNNLQVLNPVLSDTNKVLWNCKCLLCGNEVILDPLNVVLGRVLDCGCTKYYGLLNYDINYENINILGKFYCHGIYWVCRCPYCGNLFARKYYAILRGNVSSCGCIDKSVGESQISQILDNIKDVYGIDYKTEVTFPGLISEKRCKLRYDFGIYKNDKLVCLLEYDGEQHYSVDKQLYINDKEKAEKSFAELQKRDNLKNEYCVKNHIPLLRIRYTRSFDKIREEVITYLNNILMEE